MDFDNLYFEKTEAEEEDEELSQHGGSLIGKCVCLALSIVFHVSDVTWMNHVCVLFLAQFSYFKRMGLICGTCFHIFNVPYSAFFADGFKTLPYSYDSEPENSTHPCLTTHHKLFT